MAKKTEDVAVEEQVVEKEIKKYSKEDLVEIPPLFYDKERYSAPVAVLLNGHKYLIPRGKAGIKVPRAVKEILDNSEYQKQMATEYIKQHEGIKNLGEF